MIRLFGLFSPVIVPLIVSGLLVFSSEKTNRPKLYLAAYMLMISFVFMANAIYFDHNYELYSWVHSLHIGTVLAIYPGAYVYILLLTDPGRKSRQILIHFVPSIIFFLASALIFFPFLDSAERLTFLSEYRYNPDFSKKWLKLLYYVRVANITALFIQVFLYLYLIFNLLRKHHKDVSDIFSNPENFQLNWLRIFNLALSLSAFIAVFLYTVNPAKLFGDDRFMAYPMLLIALILWFLGIMGNNQPMIPVTKQPENTDNDNIKQSAGDLKDKLIEYFNNNKPYLDPDLRIWDIASALYTNRTYISNTINGSFNLNFSGFVNSFRVKEAAIRIKKDPRKPLKLVAEEVGFGSVSSLSRSFTEHMGISVSQFRKELNN